MTCAFTGHRRIEVAHKKKLGNLLSRAINYAYEQGCRRFIAGGALGFDTEAAREVLRFRMSHPDVSLVLFLPCIDQDAEWSAGQKDAFGYILNSADEIKYLADEYTKTCMKKRNMAMAEECDMLIAYASRSTSGSGQTIRMAQKLGKQVYNLYPQLEKDSF